MDNPLGGQWDDQGGDGAVPGSASGGDGDGDTGSDDDEPDADQVLLEADIVQLVGDTLYALSEAGGLFIIDAADPDALAVLGRYRADAEPFEMYVQEGAVFVMLRGYGRHLYEDEIGWTFRQSSYLLALDVSDPSDIVPIGEEELPGDIQDSRRRGDLLYVVTHENDCWGCGEAPATIVTSFDVSDLSALRRVDEARFEIESDSYAGEERSVHSTLERMYIAGPVWGPDEDGRSLVHTLDIGDGAGMLAEGVTFEVEGEIRSRWQMNEYDGVLRVVSQHPWDVEQAPVIETFTVTSAVEIEPLGRALMELPRPEELRSVRFDGPRGYAITFERTDPLFTLDLSDPSAPQQVGELEIPGWVFHMVPRGDRLLGLGFDEGNTEGSVNVSLFDVSDFASPTMLSRVHFGGDWADFTESQNRIHKAFAIHDEEGLMLVPFVGWTYDECWERMRSGVQLIELSGDSLAARGMAEQQGASRRAMLHQGRMLTLSETTVQSFDIDDRDDPQELSSVRVSRHVQHLARVGDYVVRIGTESEGGDPTLDVVPAEEPDSLMPLGSLDLGEALGSADDVKEDCGHFEVHSHGTFTDDRYLYFVQDVHSGDVIQALQVVDLADPTAPELVATFEMRDFAIGDATLDFATDATRQRVRPVGNWLVLHDADYEWDEGSDVGGSVSVLHILDLSDPEDPTLWGSIERPAGMGHGAIQYADDLVFSTRVEAVDPRAEEVAFFIDRLDLGGETPRLLPSLNVPGPVLTYDHATQRAITIAPEVELRGLDEGACYDEPTAFGYDWERDRCILMEQRLALVELGEERATIISELEVEDGEERLREAIGSDGLVFVTVGEGFSGYPYPGDVPVATAPGIVGEQPLPSMELLTVVGMDAGELRVAGRVTVQADARLEDGILAGELLVLPADDRGVGVMDASDPEQPAYALHDLHGYCEYLHVSGDMAYCALGERGAQGIEMR